MKTYRGMEVMKENTKHILCYSQFDMGAKYKIYSKSSRGIWEYNIALSSPTKAFDYFNKLFVI